MSLDSVSLVLPRTDGTDTDWRTAAFKPFLASGAWGQFLGFWECCCLAVFSYTGCELLGITADETERQRENIPKAVKRVTHRIILYYISASFTLGITVSANDPILTQTDNAIYHGPFILMLQRAGIPGLPSLVNAVMIIAAVSVATADLYVAVRHLKITSHDRVVRYMPFRWRVKRLDS